MRLKSIEYSEHENTPQRWSIKSTEFSAVNLIVGKNSTGKTRSLNIINALAGFLAGKRSPLSNGRWRVEFENNEGVNVYELNIANNEVEYEQYICRKKVVLSRTKGGSGTIYYAKRDSEDEFQCPPQQIAALARRDTTQHPFFEPLHQWGRSVRHYQFGSEMGHRSFFVLNRNGMPEFDEIDDAALMRVHAVYMKGISLVPDFADRVKQDMHSIGYLIDDIHQAIEPAVMTPNGPVIGLGVKEHDLEGVTTQITMSQGMWRAFALIIQLNYQIAKDEDCLILIDDIGEGLDYERSTAIIKLIILKSHSKNTQVIMTTNDRFVMNSVSLDYWNVAVRQGHDVKMFSKINKPKEFEEFKFVGLSNFEFFSNLPF